MNTLRGEQARQIRARLAIATFLALAPVCSVAWARPLSDQERASLEVTVEGYEAAMRKGDYARVAQGVPPKVIAAFARRTGSTPDQIVGLMTRMMQQALHGDDIKFESFSMDPGRADHKETASGVSYLLIPTETIVAVHGQRFREKSHTLALLDGGRWFFLRIKDAPHLKILVDVYPEFTSVELPSGSIEALNP